MENEHVISKKASEKAQYVSGRRRWTLPGWTGGREYAVKKGWEVFECIKSEGFEREEKSGSWKISIPR